MSTFEIGDLVVLTCGSMRMAVESLDGGKVACVWCHEGIIGRDAFDAKLLKKWEHREDHGDSRGAGTGRPYRGDREGGARPAWGAKPERSAGGERSHSDRGPSDRGGYTPRGKAEGGGYRGRKSEGEGTDERPRVKTGWDGKPREKKYFRKPE